MDLNQVEGPTKVRLLKINMLHGGVCLGSNTRADMCAGTQRCSLVVDSSALFDTDIEDTARVGTCRTFCLHQASNVAQSSLALHFARSDVDLGVHVGPGAHHNSQEWR